MKRMTDERMADIVEGRNALDDCRTVDELVEALEAERAIVDAIKTLPRYCFGLGEDSRCVDADELDALLNQAKEKPPTSEGDS